MQSQLSMRRSPVVNNCLRFFFVRYAFVFLFRLRRMLFSTVFLFALWFEPSWLGAGWGSVGEVDAASFRSASSGPKPTRSHRKTGSSQQVKMITFFKQLQRKRVRRLPELPRCDGAVQLVFELRQRWHGFEIACLHAMPDAVPTAANWNPSRVVPERG